MSTQGHRSLCDRAASVSSLETLFTERHESAGVVENLDTIRLRIREGRKIERRKIVRNYLFVFDLFA